MGFRNIVWWLKPRKSRRIPLLKKQLSTAAEKLRNLLQTQMLCARGRSTGLTKWMREVTSDRFPLSLFTHLRGREDVKNLVETSMSDSWVHC